MSSLITLNTSEGESILPEVEEFSQFHPDQLSNLVDIQEELEKLEASDNVGLEGGTPMSTVDDVNVVDHEVTIVADQVNEDMSILPEICDVHQGKHISETSIGNPYSPNMEENLEIGETITIGTPGMCDSKVIEQLNNSVCGDTDKCKPLPLTSPGQIMGQSSINLSHLKTIKPLPENIMGKKPFTGIAEPKKNVLTKVIFTPNSQAASDAPMLFGESVGQAIRIVNQNKTVITNSPRTITLAQARELGLLSPGKVQHILPNPSKGVVKKGVMVNTNKAVTMVKSSPTKILPLPTTGQLHPIAPSPGVNTLPSSHKIFIRQSASLKSGSFSGTILSSTSTISQGHILQIPVSQENINNQIHQIQLPGKQVQYVRLVNSATTNVTTVNSAGPVETFPKSEPIPSSTASSRPVPVALTTNVSNVPQLKMMPLTSGQHIPVSDSQEGNSFERVLVSPGLSQLTARPDAKTPSNFVMVPAEYVKQCKPLPTTSPPSPPKPVVPVIPVVQPSLPVTPPTLLTKGKESLNLKDQSTLISVPSTQKSKTPSDPPNGIRPRKPCNCTKSQCLKLYCDCFANGEFCYKCNCNSCFNNLDHEEERQRAIKACLERNPNAFRPKIGKGYIGDERRHNKGCNCKRSGCLKNYCECYEAKIPCSNNCKCIGCRNIEETKDVHDNTNHEGSKTNQQMAVKNKLSCEIQESAYKPHIYTANNGMRQPFNLMTQEVVEATCQCLLAQVEGDGQLPEQLERLILEEFGRCLVEIIECATRTTVNNVT